MEKNNLKTRKNELGYQLYESEKNKLKDSYENQKEQIKEKYNNTWK